MFHSVVCIYLNGGSVSFRACWVSACLQRLRGMLVCLRAFFYYFFLPLKSDSCRAASLFNLEIFLDLKKKSVWYVSDIKSPSILSSSSRKDRVRENKLKELTFSQPSMKTWDWERHECGRSLQHIAKYTRYNTRVLPSSQCHGRVWASPVHRIGQPASVF